MRADCIETIKMNPTKHKTLKLLRKIYNTKIRVVKRNRYTYWGAWNLSDIIYVNSNVSTLEFIQTIFHELGHSYCYRNNIWFKYHNYDHAYDMKYLSKKKKLALRLTALKAERWVDKWAKKEYRKYYPNTRWRKAYRYKYQVKYLYDTFLDELK